MSIRLIALDIDDTLLIHRKLLPNTITTIKKVTTSDQSCLVFRTTTCRGKPYDAWD